MAQADKRIKLTTVLAEIDQYERDGKLHYFSLDYRKVDGKKGYKSSCRKSGNKISQGNAVVSSNFRYKVKEKGVLMLVDNERNQPFSVKICLLTHFNGIRIQH